MRSYTSTAATSVIGDASQDVFFPTKVFSLAGVRDGGVRVGSFTHEGIRVKAKPLVHLRAARSMVERSLLTCLSGLHDVHPRLVPGIGQYRATTHLIRRRARLHRSLRMPAKFASSLVMCSRTCIQMYEQKEEGLACRRVARSMVTRSLLFIVRL